MRANWGAIAVGGVAGLMAGVVLAIPLLATGVADSDTFSGQAALILVAFAAQVAAGYVAVRVAGYVAPAFHGGVAGLGLFAVVSLISIATGGEPGVGTLSFGAIVALVLGTAGGVLAAALRHRSD